MIDFTEDEYDLLKEVFNLAMGQAAAGVAVLLKSFVDLNVPDIKIVKAEKVVETILVDNSPQTDQQITATRQTFYLNNILDGEAIVTFDDQTFDNVSKLLGFEEKMDRQSELEIMLEMTNIMVGACMNGISNQLFNKEMSFVPPTVLSEGSSYNKVIYGVFQRSQLHWDYTMLAKISFKLKNESFKSEMLIFMSEQATNFMHQSISKMLAEF
ncbi:MAG: hypothetical protein HQL06_14025 [Nitrospirae bacterium]|nr:hypothetical protein [Nitrospirota bacterium]